MIALERNATWVVKNLLAVGANMHIENPEGKSSLQLLFSINRLSDTMLHHFFPVVRKEAASEEDFARRLFLAGCQPYHAVHLNNHAVIDFLLEYGIDVDSPTFTGKTALMIAALIKNFAMVSMLLDRGADVNAVDERGQNALFYCQKPNSSPCCRFSAGSEIIMQLLLERGADVNAQHRISGETLLYIVYKNKAEIVDSKAQRELDTWAELLILRNAYPLNSFRSMDKTILEHAYHNANTFRTKLLIAHVSMLQSLGKRVIESLMNSTVEEFYKKFPEFGKYHNVCQKMLKIPVFESQKLLDLLTTSEKMLKVYLRDEDFLPKLRQFYNEYKLGSHCPLYYKKLEERVGIASRSLKLENKAMLMLLKIMHKYFCYDVANNIMGYLNKCDMECLSQIED
ncbi:uncharacterized protein LOC131673432 isoform X5 [Phymastichus coffea]|uniref:uncharacterized protein LOC131673432 isoform X5 n=2 Tax=Phymastichus coffea TaxID=108790 RepID=UPI00273B08B6|nr:uncharacterized protein LOC131673432 isoform X5 [Phymastichus coffea]